MSPVAPLLPFPSPLPSSPLSSPPPTPPPTFPSNYFQFSPLPPSSPPSARASSLPTSPCLQKSALPPAPIASCSTVLFRPHPIVKSPVIRSPRSPTSRLRALSLPPLSSDDVSRSPNWTGTNAERVLFSRQRGYAKQSLTLKKNYEALFREQELEQIRQDNAIREAEVEKQTYFASVLDALQTRGYTFGDLVIYVSDPVHKQKMSRWSGMLKDNTFISRILGIWAFKTSKTTKEQVQDWAVGYVLTKIRREVRKISESRYLQTNWRPIDSKLILGFNLSNIHSYFQEHGSIFMSVLSALATSPRQLKKMSVMRMAKKIKVITASALSLVGEYSYQNNWSKKAIGLYLYSTGSQRQPISVLSHLGISESYYTIIGKKDSDKNIAGGSLRQLSETMLDMARIVASRGLFGTSYDNINMVFRAAEQIVGRTDAMENGTCATIWALFKASLNDMRVPDLETSFANAPPLSISDVLLTSEESVCLNTNLIHCILRIIVTHGGEGVNKFHRNLADSAPSSNNKIDLHQTPLHPLPAFDIDESTIIGGAEVIDAVFDTLKIKDAPGWTKIVRFICGDQLTIARLRSLVNIRAGHEGGYTGFGWGVWMPGLFHAKMTDIHGVLVTHWGKSSAGARNPGSLVFHNTVLQRKPILLTSLPPFRTCRDLVFVSLYARVLHCLLIISNTSSLAAYSETATWEGLVADAKKILSEYASPDIVAALRWRRNSVHNLDSPSSEGDMILENAILFLRDALLSREFTDAVKAGDSGRVVLLLKTWALSFRGSGRTKYAHEMLHLIHNLTHVWPKGIRDIVLNNWLINTTGKPNSWIEVDLMQEHMNFWIKNFYRAHGSAASWAWLEMIAPCVQVLRDLGHTFKQMLGTDVGSAHHPMDLSIDIPDLMQSLEDHEIYLFKKGRSLDEEDAPVPDIISTGLDELINSKSSPLNDYNAAFQHLQARRRLISLVTYCETGPSNPPSPSTAPLQVPDSDPTRPLSNSIAHLEDQAEEQSTGFDEEGDANMSDAGDSATETDNEDIGDFLRSFEVTTDSDQLLLLNAADVSLDMDAEDLQCHSRDNLAEDEPLDSDLDSSAASGDDEPNDADELLISDDEGLELS